MRYLSVCSGIEAATCAWHPLGWSPVAFSEIEPFPCAVLAHHYPAVPNWGDMTKFKEWPDAAIDLLVGGTPCQSFSVAGLRKGLADPRGNLMLTYLAIADRYRPEWLVWENVPGVLSSNEGKDFGALLGGLAELGYGFAYRVLDAQYVRVESHARAVPQRRRRVFVVGCLGDWRRAAAVLFERESLSGHPPPRREAGQRPAPTISARSKGGGGLGTDAELDGALLAVNGLVPSVANPLTARMHKGINTTCDEGQTMVAAPVQRSVERPRGDGLDTLVAHSLHTDDFDASEDGTGRGVPLVPVAYSTKLHNTKSNQAGKFYEEYTTSLNANSPPPAVAYRTAGDGAVYQEGDAVAPLTTGTDPCASIIAFDTTQISSKANYSNPQPGDPCHPLAAGAHPPAVALAIRGRDGVPQIEEGGDVANAVLTPNGGRAGIGVGAVRAGMMVRRLTPMECERLQGFSDGYTLIQVRGKPAADGPRYKALGNSMAVNCMFWIGQRIESVANIRTEQVAA